MRQFVISEFITVDGIIDSPGGGSHPQAGWTFNQIDFLPEAYEIKGREQQEAAALLLGRVTYEEFAPVWPTMSDFAEYNEMMKYVVSTGSPDLPWGPAEVLSGLDQVAELKQQEGGPILVQGSAQLAQRLAAAGLVDRYHLLVFPVLLGVGKRLFEPHSAMNQHFELVEHEAYDNGIVKLVYQR